MTTGVSPDAASLTREDFSVNGVAEDVVNADKSTASCAELMNGTVGAGFFGPDQRAVWTADGKDDQGVPVAFFFVFYMFFFSLLFLIFIFLFLIFFIYFP